MFDQNFTIRNDFHNIEQNGVDANLCDMQQKENLRNRVRKPKIDPADTENAAIAILKVLGIYH